MITLLAFFAALSRLCVAAPRVSSSWYASWHASEGFPVSKVSWDKYTQVYYSFAETAPDVTQLSISNETDVLPEFVQAAHDNGVKAILTVGGWTGSRFFSTNVGSTKNRTAFVKTVTTAATKYNFDGLDFDWEYPGNQGIGCNTISPNDTANFLSFLKELRADPVGHHLILSAATATVPFIGPDGNPLTNISGFADVLDYIEVMNYDIWGPWSSSVGPNAPLNDTCASADNQVGSAVSAVQAWAAAGMPHNKIILGVASYGHSFSVNAGDAFVKGSTTKLAAYPAFNADIHPAGDTWDDPPAVDECGVFENQGGDIDFWGLIAQGYLSPDGEFLDHVPHRFDACSQTPYVYNTTTQVEISFDNAESFAAKGTFIKNAGLAGFAMWETGGDMNDILLDSIRSAAGFNMTGDAC